MKSYRVIGIMSGTSLDGVDVAACVFNEIKGKWLFEIIAAKTFPYTKEWKNKLSGLPATDAFTFALTDTQYGHLLGKMVSSFLEETRFDAELIASHGHTIFHRPELGLTVQIGDGSAIAAETGLPVICDFRKADVAMGGQGAPLVPVGDKMLFPEYDACINLGGFSNISMDYNGERIAFDICPVNIILNQIASNYNLPYDKDGRIAASGIIIPQMLEELNQLDHYHKPHPKSLGREWLEQEFIPLLKKYDDPSKNIMRTLCEHMAIQINRAIKTHPSQKILLTGGGARNKFLLKRITETGGHDYRLPEDELIDFKEALIFAFLGLLRWRGETNVLRSVTGSAADHSGGTIWQPFVHPI